MKKTAMRILTVLMLLCVGGFLYLVIDIRKDLAAAPEISPEPAALSAPADTPAPTVTPEPEPEPTPTPKPLLPVELTDGRIAPEYFFDANERGEIFMTEYETRDYVGDPNTVFTKQMGVYLPYNYDPEGQYDVLFLFHIKGADENFWLHDGLYYEINGEMCRIDIFTLLDNMIEQGRCRPVIVFAPDLYPNDTVRYTHNSDYTYPQLRREFADDILPFVVENYATCAEGTDRAAISAAREHFGVIGASYGAYAAYNCVMRESFDMVANYGLTGGGTVDWYRVLEKDYGAELPMNCLYFGAGEHEPYEEPYYAYLGMRKMTDVFSENNLYFTVFDAAEHDSRTWINTLYNSLQVFYR